MKGIEMEAPEDRASKCALNEVVSQESDCLRCSHQETCRKSMHEFCVNFCADSSVPFIARENVPAGCSLCVHRPTRFGRGKHVPCFKCSHEERRQRDGRKKRKKDSA